MPDPAKTEVYLGIGSNLEDPIAQVSLALAALAQILDDLRCSPLYRTRPIGPITQPDFINCVVSGWTAAAPEVLLDQCQAIEASQGRTRTLHWGPRTLDIDLLFIGTLRMQTPRLTLPHPEALKRGFVMIPLADLRPNGETPLGDPIDRSRYDADGLEQLDRLPLSFG